MFCDTTREDAMYRFAICDDDAENLKYMKEQICAVFMNSDNHAELDISLFQTGEDIVNAYVAEQIDVVFMDIELENNTLGFDIARKLCRQKRNTAIVYMSNHDHYVTKSFVCRPLGFIRKHYAKEDLEMVMDEIMRYLKEECTTLTFYHNTKSVTLDINEIYAVEVFNHDLRISLKNNKEITIRDQMLKHISELEENGFVLIRRGIAINVRYIEKIDSSILTMINGNQYTIGRENISKVRQQWLNNRFL